MCGTSRIKLITIVFALAATSLLAGCDSTSESAADGAPPADTITPPADSGVDAATSDEWVITMGGAMVYATSMVKDSSGALYVTGGFKGAAKIGGTTRTSEGDFDIYLWKMIPPAP